MLGAAKIMSSLFVAMLPLNVNTSSSTLFMERVGVMTPPFVAFHLEKLETLETVTVPSLIW